MAVNAWAVRDLLSDVFSLRGICGITLPAQEWLKHFYSLGFLRTNPERFSALLKHTYIDT